jgi:hypothetical protein
MAKPNFKNKPKRKKSFIKTKKRKEDPRIGLYNQLMQCETRVNDLRATNGRTAVHYVSKNKSNVHPLDNFLFDLEAL